MYELMNMINAIKSLNKYMAMYIIISDKNITKPFKLI
jgi:hypothetical protein